MAAGRLDAFSLWDEVIGTYRDYVQGFIKIGDPRVADEVDAALASGNLWPEPWVQINPTYKLEADTRRLIEEGVFDPEAFGAFSDGTGEPWQFYTHQVEAFRRAEAGRPFVMTTGTGSGKSVTYIAPIINHVLRDKRQHPGRSIRAIIVYPMNALANSQLEALNGFLPGGSVHDAVDDDGVFHPEKLTSKVTFARYTGQESEKEREADPQNPPDILLTNYVMLELLLTRPYDRALLGQGGARAAVPRARRAAHLPRAGRAPTSRCSCGACRAQVDAQATGPISCCVGTSATLAGGGHVRRAARRGRVRSPRRCSARRSQPSMSSARRCARRHADDEPRLGRRADRGAWPSGRACRRPSYDELVADPLASWIERRSASTATSDGTLRAADSRDR